MAEKSQESEGENQLSEKNASEGSPSIQLSLLPSVQLEPSLEQKPNEKLFVHSMSLFFAYLKPWILSEEHFRMVEEQYSDYLNYMMKVFGIEVDKKRVFDLVTASIGRAARYKYKISLVIVGVLGADSLQLEPSYGDQLKFKVSYLNRTTGKMKKMGTIEFHKNYANKWLPKMSSDKDFNFENDSMLEIPLNAALMNIDICLNFDLLYVMYKRGVGKKIVRSLTARRYGIKRSTVGSFSLPVSQINPEGFCQWIQFGTEIYLKIRLKWAFGRNFLSGGYFHFSKNFTRHHAMLNYFLMYRFVSTHGKNKPTRELKTHATDASAVNTDLLGLFINKSAECFVASEKRQTFIDRANDIQVRNSYIESHLALDDTYCICGEWCSLDSFFFHNSFIRWALVQNHRLSRISDEILIPYYIRTLAKLIVNTRCCNYGLLESAVYYLDLYFKALVKKYNYMYVIRKSREVTVLSEAYLILRQHVKPNVFFNSNVFEMIDAFKVYCILAVNLRDSLNIDDKELNNLVSLMLCQLFLEWCKNINDEKIKYYCLFTLLENQSVCDEVQTSVSYAEEAADNTCSLTVRSSLQSELAHRFFAITSTNQPRSVETKELLQQRQQQLSHKFNKPQRPLRRRDLPTFGVSKQLAFYHKLQNLLISIKRIVLVTSSNPSDRLRNEEHKKAQIEFVKLLNQIFILHIESNPAANRIKLRSHQSDSDSQRCYRAYVLTIYSQAFDFLQLYLHSAITVYFNEKHEFRYDNNIISFFTHNDWIETSGLPSGSQEEFLFSSKMDFADAFAQSFDLFYHKKWGLRRLKQLFAEVKSTGELAALLETETIALRQFHKANMDSDFNEIILLLKNVTLKTFQSTDKLFKQDFAAKLSRCLAAASKQNIEQLTEKWILKALGFNLICIMHVALKHFIDLCQDKDARTFSALYPGWFPLFEFFESLLVQLHEFATSTLKTKLERSETMVSIYEEGKKLWRILFMKVTRTWFQDFKHLVKKAKTSPHSNFMHIASHFFIIGLCILIRFGKAFPKRFNFLTKRVEHFLHSNEVSNKLLQDIFAYLWADVNAIAISSPFESKIWSDLLKTNEAEVDAAWQRLRQKRNALQNERR